MTQDKLRISIVRNDSNGTRDMSFQAEDEWQHDKVLYDVLRVILVMLRDRVSTQALCDFIDAEIPRPSSEGTVSAKKVARKKK